MLALHGPAPLEGNEGFAFRACDNRSFNRLVCAPARALLAWDYTFQAPA